MTLIRFVGGMLFRLSLHRVASFIVGSRAITVRPMMFRINGGGMESLARFFFS